MAKSKQVLELATLNVGHRRPVSPSQSRVMQNMTAVGQSWTALTPAERAPWQALANQMPHDTGLRTTAGLKQKRPMSAFQAYSALNATLLACGQDILAEAPASPLKPEALPPVLLSATATTTAADTATLPFTLTLTVPSYYNFIQIYAAAPLLAGQYPTGQNAVLLTTITNPTTGPLDLAPAFAAKFGPLVPGQQVALTLIPVSTSGFKGTPLSVSADVNAPATSAQRQGDTTRALKAA